LLWLNTAFTIGTVAGDLYYLFKDEGNFGEVLKKVPLSLPLLVFVIMAIIFLSLLTQYHYRITIDRETTHEQLK